MPKLHDKQGLRGNGGNLWSASTFSQVQTSYELF
jgi:hypothetical protein